MSEQKAQVNFLEDFTRRDIETPDNFRQKKRLPNWLKVFFVILIVFGIFFSGAFLSGTSSLNNESGGLPKVGITQVWTAFKGYVLGQEGELEGQVEDRINILLLGMGGLGHDGPYLTDTMIIASIKPSTGQVSMISIPRDLYVPIPNFGWNKINHANSFGETDMNGQGGELASQTIEEVFNLPIHYYVRVDFSGFEQIIDDLGGIKVNVERSFIDQEYPAPNFEYQVVSFKAGEQKMDGDTALKFVRSRHGNNGEGSDFARSQRQQKVIMAIKDKTLSASTLLNPSKINKMLKTLGNNISTNLDADEIIYLSKFVENFTGDDLLSFNFSSAEGNFLVSDFASNGAYILRPKTGNFNQMANLMNNIFEQTEFIAEHKELEDQLYQSAVAIEQAQLEAERKSQEEAELLDSETSTDLQETIPIKIIVLNGTKIAGLAGKTAKNLEEMDFEIIDIANSPDQTYESTFLYQINTDSDFEPNLENLTENYSFELSEIIPSGFDTYTSQKPDFVLVLGPDNS